MNAATKRGLDSVKTASKKVGYKKAEDIGELIENKISEKIVKANPLLDENSRNIEEIIFLTEKSQDALNEFRQILYNRTL